VVSSIAAVERCPKVRAMRERVSELLESQGGKNAVLILILLNALLMGAETYPYVSENHGALLAVLDKLILVLFSIEIVVRLYAAGSLKKYVSDPWNLFDVAVVGVSWLPIGGSYVSVARLLRVLRVLRAATIFPQLRKLVSTLLKSIPAMGHIGLLLAILLYGYGVVGTVLFSETVPEFFPTLHRSILTLFQVVTLEGWNEILFACLEHHPYSWIYFVSFIFLGTFITFNLFVGVIIENMEKARDEEDKVEEEAFEKKVLTELAELRKLVAESNARRSGPSDA
jgi:voltage-gated sodium channel